MYTGKKEYRDDNCKECIHNGICKIQEEYISHLVLVRELVDPKIDKFGIKISCNWFSESQPTIMRV